MKLKQDPVLAPTVLSVRSNEIKGIESSFMTKFTLTTTELLSDKKEHVYLF